LEIPHLKNVPQEALQAIIDADYLLYLAGISLVRRYYKRSASGFILLHGYHFYSNDEGLGQNKTTPP